MNYETLAVGDRVYRWWDAGIEMTLQPLTIMRLNRVTATVRTDQGNRFRIKYPDLHRHIRPDEEEILT